jgi:protein gp37
MTAYFDWLRRFLGVGFQPDARDFELAREESHSYPLPNVWLGTSVEDQQRADERIPHLLQTPATVRWLSIEPLLEPIELRTNWNWSYDEEYIPQGWQPDLKANYIRWAVLGGESGPGARPMDLAWARSLRDQCALAGVPFFMKQLGSVWARQNNSRTDGRRDTKGGCMENWPADLRVRQFPTALRSQSTEGLPSTTPG